MARKVDVYTLAELQDQFPDAFERVHKEWERLTMGNEAPWSGEVVDSLRAVLKASGARLTNWSIGPDDGSLTVSVDDEDEDGAPKDASWFIREVLAPNGYVKDGAADFPGHCAFTGYCADDDFLESAYKALQGGDSLTDALQGLASDASRMMRDDLEQMCGVESMLANWGENEYTEDGTEV